MGLMITVESSTNRLSQLVDGQGTIWFENTTLGVEPFGFDGVKPGTLGRQGADQQANALSSALDLLVMSAYPGSHSLTAMPRSVIPDQSQDSLAEGLGFVAQPGEKFDGDGTHRTPIDKAQPDLLGLLLRHEQTVASKLAEQ